MQSPSRAIDEAAGVFVSGPYPDEADHPNNTKPVGDDDFDEPLGAPNQCRLDDPGCESCS